jgi:hypothetical protein
LLRCFGDFGILKWALPQIACSHNGSEGPKQNFI